MSQTKVGFKNVPGGFMANGLFHRDVIDPSEVIEPEAHHIVQLNEALSNALTAELRWMPENSDQKYGSNMLFTGNIQEMVERIVHYRKNADVIYLTTHNGLIYL